MHRPLHIVAPDIHAGDAVGNHCICLAQDLIADGMEVSVYAQRFTSDHLQIRPIEQLFDSVQSQDRLLVSYSIFDPYLERLLALEQHKLCYFHGVTPASLLREHEPVTADLCQKSVSQFPLLAGFDRLAFNSEFNRRDLSPYIDTRSAAVIPPVSARLPLFQRPAFPFSETQPLRILMLGRIVPHKRIEHGIQMLAELRRRALSVDLDLVGSCHNAVYAGFLEHRAQSLGVSDSVHMWGMLSDAAVAERFALASALLVASEHEGFCVPVLEAMHLGVPAVVREGTAAVEVGGPATASYADLPQGIGCLEQLLTRPELRRERVKSGFDRSTALIRQASVGTWMALLDSL